MSVVEAQIPLPVPPTGADLTVAESTYNPHSGYFEPVVKNPPLPASLAVTNVAQALIAGLVAANPAWIYHMIFTNTTVAQRTYTLTEPGAQTYVVVVGALASVAIVSTPSAPLFRSTAAGNITVVGDALVSGNISIMYVVK